MPDAGIGETLVGLGIGQGTASILGPALLGAGGGAGLSLLTGGSPLKGAEAGALTGGGIGLGGELLGSTLGATAAEALGGAAGGAIGSEVTGGKPLIGALEGGLSGGISGALSGPPSATPSAGGTVGSAGTGAYGTAAPSSVSPDPLGAGSFTPDTSTLSNLATKLSDSNIGTIGDLGTSATSTSNIGTGTTGSQNIPSGGNAATGQFDLAGNFGGGGGGGSQSLTSAANEAAKAPTSIDKFISNPGFGTGFDILKANPSAAISAGGIGLDLLKGNATSGAEKNLAAEASQLGQQGQRLQSYLESGTLPPGLQAGLNQAADAAKASIRSRFASMGLSGSSAEQQELAQVDMNMQAQSAQIAQQLLATGIQETGGASQLYSEMLKNTMAQDTTLQSAIANFSSAAAGGGKMGNITINTGAGGNVL